MLVTVNLRSKKENEINKFLSSFYNTNMNIPKELTWQHQYKNPIEITDIIGVFVDNLDYYDLKMWVCLDKNIYINISDNNGDKIIRYLFERFPY